MSDRRITLADVRAAGFCAWGLRKFTDRHGLDLRVLVREGIPESQVQHIRDARLDEVREKARARWEKEGLL